MHPSQPTTLPDMTPTLEEYVTKAVIAWVTQNSSPPSRAYLDSLKTAYEVIYGIQMGETQSQQESQEAGL